MPNAVLVAGASGPVGAAVVDRFLDDGWDVIAVSRRKPQPALIGRGVWFLPPADRGAGTST